MLPTSTSVSLPQFLLLACLTGLAGVGVMVARWRVVHHIFGSIVAGVIGAGTVVGIIFGLGYWGWLMVAGALLAGIGGSRLGWAIAGFSIAGGAGFLMAAQPDFLPQPFPVHWGLALTGSLAMGGVSGEMMLAHFYFVNPTLPRWPLRRLALVSMVGLLIDMALLIAGGGEQWGQASGVVWAVFAGLWLTSMVLLALVWFALDQRAYSGVMSATGLSYLSIMTSLGVVYLGRLVLAGQSPW